MRPEIELVPASESTDLPAVSVICPTYQRPKYLRRQVENFLAQTYGGALEMIVFDDSPEPSGHLFDPEYEERGVRYHHMPAERLTIGSKLQAMAKLARGQLIAVFDDDDYYAPQYIERMVRFLGDADFCTLSRWFAYSPEQRTFAYWASDILSPTHYVFSPWEPVAAMPISTDGWNPDWVIDKLWGYGFSYIWRKNTLPQVEIADITFADVCWDWDFYRKVKKAGLKAVCAPDNEGLIIHILHPEATTKMFPQYILPEFMLADYFPLYTPVEN
ncbi:glycosyltransferase family 2 protein [Nocardia sp. BMG111209]|uniref:glycosyltransferase family 2 protein n=1 Tax=Nocardia sp. BMG111209 TaxID=1160137 RepID=UPI000362D0D2|nr:glycosyltransferase family 2 protein [Nocardia sp. BMG111209]